jgi:hypothetical protein
MKNTNDKKRIVETQGQEKQEYEKMKLRLVSRNGVDVVCASGGNTEEDWFDDNVDAGGWT